MNKVLYASSLAVLVASFAANADSILRVKCDDKDSGAQIFINGKLVGDCPLDAPAPTGNVELRARKTVGQDQEQVFEKRLRVLDGVPQRVEVILSAPQLTAEGLKRQQVAEADTQLRAAEAGNVDAMNKLAAYYDAGVGVGKDPAKAKIWRAKAETATAQNQLRAAEGGDIKAMQGIAARYAAGQGVKMDPEQAAAWRAKSEAAERAQVAQAEALKARNLAAQKAAEKEQRISSVSYLENTDKLLNRSGLSKDIGNNVTSILSTGVPVMFLGLTSDGTSAPTRTTEINKIRDEIAFRPAAWGKPDSMIARAARRLETGRTATEDGAFSVAVR